MEQFQLIFSTENWSTLFMEASLIGRLILDGVEATITGIAKGENFKPPSVIFPGNRQQAIL